MLNEMIDTWLNRLCPILDQIIMVMRVEGPILQTKQMRRHRQPLTLQQTCRVVTRAGPSKAPTSSTVSEFNKPIKVSLKLSTWVILWCQLFQPQYLSLKTVRSSSILKTWVNKRVSLFPRKSQGLTSSLQMRLCKQVWKNLNCFNPINANNSALCNLSTNYKTSIIWTNNCQSFLIHRWEMFKWTSSLKFHR